MMTPSDSPSAPELYAAVPVQETGILADQDDLGGAVAGAKSEAMGRQPETERLLSGADGASVTAGYAGAGGEDWPADVSPGT